MREPVKFKLNDITKSNAWDTNAMDLPDSLPGHERARTKNEEERNLNFVV